MTTSTTVPVRDRDTAALIGMLAILEGAIWGGVLDEWTTGILAQRLAADGLLTAGHDESDLRQAIGDLNQRLRHALGEYDSAGGSDDR